MTLLFVMAFEFGPGTVVWLYMSEICNDKAVSIATLLNWTFNLIVSTVSPFGLNGSLKMQGMVFLVFGGVCAFSSIVIMLFMKETKGLSSEEVKKLYRTDNDIISTFESRNPTGDIDHDD